MKYEDQIVSNPATRIQDRKLTGIDILRDTPVHEETSGGLETPEYIDSPGDRGVDTDDIVRMKALIAHVVPLVGAEVTY